MDSLDGTVSSRRIVIDAEALGYKPAGTGKANGKQPRRRRRRKTSGDKEAGDAGQNAGNIESVSMELQPLINAAIAYGRKTHALGAMKAVSALSSLAERLRSLEVQPPGLSEIVEEAENEATEIRTMLCRSYEA